MILPAPCSRCLAPKMRMKHAINVDNFIASIRMQPGYDAGVEKVFLEAWVPLIEDAYQDGKANRPGYPYDPEVEISIFEEINGPMRDLVKHYATLFTHFVNSAYMQGQQEKQSRLPRHVVDAMNVSKLDTERR